MTTPMVATASPATATRQAPLGLLLCCQWGGRAAHVMKLDQKGKNTLDISPLALLLNTSPPSIPEDIPTTDVPFDMCK